MPTLDAFDTPGRVRDLGDDGRAAWDARVRKLFGRFTGDFPQIYDPTETDTPAGAQRAPIVWAAFPARLLPDATSEEARWTQADGSRDEQDEYCEWAVERDGDVVTAVTFTSEVPEYWDHLRRHDPGRLVTLYKELVDPGIELADLLGPGGDYDPMNAANREVPGRLVHLSQAATRCARRSPRWSTARRRPVRRSPSPTRPASTSTVSTRAAW